MRQSSKRSDTTAIRQALTTLEEEGPIIEENNDNVRIRNSSHTQPQHDLLSQSTLRKKTTMNATVQMRGRNIGFSQSMHAGYGNRNSRSLGTTSTTSMSMIRSKSGDDIKTRPLVTSEHKPSSRRYTSPSANSAQTYSSQEKSVDGWENENGNNQIWDGFEGKFSSRHSDQDGPPKSEHKSLPVNSAWVGFDGGISSSRSPVLLPLSIHEYGISTVPNRIRQEVGTTPTISSFGIDDKSSGGICNNRRRGIGISNKRQIRNSGLSQTDHVYDHNTGTSRTAVTTTTTTTTALLRGRIVYLEKSNSSLLERVASLEKHVSSLLAQVLSSEGEKSRIGTDSTIIDNSKANNNNNNTNNNTSDTILVIDDSTTGLPDNLQQKNNDRKEKKQSMRKKRHNTTTTKSNNRDDTKKREPRSQNKTANNRSNTGRNGRKRGTRGSKSLSTDDRKGLQSNVTNGSVDRRKSFLNDAAKRTSKWLLVSFKSFSWKNAETEQDDRSQSSSSSSSSILMSQTRKELDDLLENYSKGHNVSHAQLDPHETAKKRSTGFRKVFK